MRTISLREEQLLELEILDVFAQFCEKNNLHYFLDAGTLIGAIRHKGFIPWDDDIDVCLLRPDYDRFIQLMQSNNNMLNGHIKLELEKESLYPYLKLVDTRTVLIEYPDTNPVKTSIYIDIFPKDGVKNKKKLEVRRAKKIKRLILVAWLRSFTAERLEKTDKVHDKLLGGLIKLLIPETCRLKEHAILLAKKYNVETCLFVSSLVCSGLGGCVEKECFSEQIEVEFEGKIFKAPIGYDAYLHSLYPGDYMELPPIEKRVAHKTEIYWKGVN